jgi:hypothetical protein
MIIPESYYTEKKAIELTQADIDIIIEELERTEYNIYTFMNYDKLIAKYKEAKRIYCKSDNGKLSRKRYQSSIKFKLATKRYRQSIKGILWRQSDKAKDIALRARLKRIEMKHNCIHLFTKEEWQLKCKATKGVCPCCHNLFDDHLHKLTLDHIFALYWANEYFKQTGKKYVYTINKIQPLCLLCNSTKKENIVVEVKPKDLNTHQSNIILTTR